MATSKQLQIRSGVAALVAAACSVDGGVHQNREYDLATGKTAQAHVNFTRTFPVDQMVYTAHPRDWATEIELKFLTRKNGSVEATDAADALWVAAYGAVMADQSLGGLAWELLPGEATVEDAQGDTSLCRLTWTLTVHHRTTNNTLT
jgi:hypothetical protein